MSVTIRFFDDGRKEIVLMSDIVTVDGSEMPAPVAIGCFVTVRGTLRSDSRAVVISDKSALYISAAGPNRISEEPSKKRRRTSSAGKFMHRYIYILIDYS